VLALAVAAEVGGGVLGGRAAVGGMFFSTMPAVSPTFARVCSVSVTVTLVALSHSAVLYKKFTVFDLPVMEQALLYQNVSFCGGPHFQEEGPMLFATLQCLDTPRSMKNFDSRFQKRFWDAMLNMDFTCSFRFTLLNFTAWAMTKNLWP
jgi:hypothetical protein